MLPVDCPPLAVLETLLRAYAREEREGSNDGRHALIKAQPLELNIETSCQERFCIKSLAIGYYALIMHHGCIN